MAKTVLPELYKRQLAEHAELLDDLQKLARVVTQLGHSEDIIFKGVEADLIPGDEAVDLVKTARQYVDATWDNYREKYPQAQPANDLAAEVQRVKNLPQPSKGYASADLVKHAGQAVDKTFHANDKEPTSIDMAFEKAFGTN